MKKINYPAMPKDSFQKTKNREFFYALLSLLLLLAVVVVWFFKLKPIQNRYETNLTQYPAQLAQIQELNKNVQNYKNSEVLRSKMSELEFLKLQNKLVAQGLQFTNLSFENTNPPKINIQIKEIEFNQWLKLQEEFKRNNGLFIDRLLITRGNSPAVVEINASLVQSP
jgi:type II secretory pathway component PulM